MHRGIADAAGTDWRPRLGRGHVRRSIAVGLLALSICCALVASAAAATGHKFASQITEAAGEPLSLLSGLAVNHASGEVFVLDGEVVDVYTASGEYKTSFGQGLLTGGAVSGVAVDKITGHVYVADSSANVIYVYKPNGAGGYALLATWTGAHTPGAQFGELTAVAVNAASGVVYVADLGQGLVEMFKANPPGPEEAAEGAYTGALKGGKLETPNGLAVSEATSRVYVSDEEAIKTYSGAGTFEVKVSSKSTPVKEGALVAVAVDESSGDFFASSEGSVFEFTSTGAYTGTLSASRPGTPFLEARGLAVSAAGKVYVADAGSNVVDVFEPGEAVPSVKTLAPSAAKIARTTATLRGTFNPESVKGATCHFEYETQEGLESTGEFKKQAPCVLNANAEAAVTGLSAETTYVYRIVGENENKVANFGVPVEFVTDEAVSGVTPGAVQNLEPTSATLTASLTPEGFATKYHFEYGETTEYGTSVPVPDLETSEPGPVPASEAISGLRPNTTYHFRLVASNEFGTTKGPDSVFRTPGPPLVTPEAPTEVGQSTAKLHAKINPEQRDTTYHFEYGPSAAYGTSTPIPDADIGSGSAPVAVLAELTGLQIATTYHFRVVAENAAGKTVGPDQEFTTVLLEGVSAQSVTSESATLTASLNPQGVDTTYHFEYGESSSYGASIPVPDEDIGAGGTSTLVRAELFGLHPGVTYHYRIVVTLKGVGKAASADATFTTPVTGVAFKLPDNRAYELVSPPNKHGGYIEPINEFGGAVQASADGSALAYTVNGPILEEVEGNRSPEPQQVLATRGPTSWTNQEIATPHSAALGLRPGKPAEYLLFSSDLALSLVQPFPLALTGLAEPPLSPPLSEAERGHQQKTIYVRNNTPIVPNTAEAELYAQAKQSGELLASEHKETVASAGYVALVNGTNTAPGVEFGGIGGRVPNLTQVMSFLGATPELTHSVIGSEFIGLTSDSSGPGLYESVAGQLVLISILPNGTQADANSTSSGRPTLAIGYGSEVLKQTADRTHAISNDGSRVFWTYSTATETKPIGEPTGHLYMRDLAKHETLQIDAAEAGLKVPSYGTAKFQIASTDGKRVFFTDTQRLTASSAAVSPGHADLYECEIVEVGGKDTCNLIDLTAAPNQAASVQGYVLGAAEDGSSVYYVATAVLAEGAQSGAFNLYRASESGGTWTNKFLAGLSSEDGPDWAKTATGGPGAEFLTRQTSRVSPSGEYLTFMSNRRLTGFNNTDVNEANGEHHADEEVFLYHAATSKLTCVSCNPRGARPRGVFDQSRAGEGNGLLVDQAKTWDIEKPGTAHWLAGNIPGWVPVTQQIALYQSRYLLDSGRMFFTSADALVPQAEGHMRTETIAGKAVSVGVENVYQYEPSGVGDCTREAGCVSLISSGTSERESAFLDASATGSDVFFLTSPALISQDVDVNFDVYDARVCSEASPCQVPPPIAAEPCTNVESCRPATVSVPSFTPPPTAPLGSGNLVVGPGNQVLANKTTTIKRAPTRAQKLAKALKQCHKLPQRSRAQKRLRNKCEATARKRYGTVKHGQGGKKK